MTAPAFNADQIRHFIRLLTGNESTPVTWQVYYDPKGLKRDDLAAQFVATYQQALPFLIQSQNNQCGVYIGLNGSDGKGRKKANIVNFRALFADFDNIDQPVWPIPPHFITQRDATHGHAFWLVDDIASQEQFSELQRRISLSTGSDEQVVDPSRVVRAPGTLHFKDPLNPKQYVITVDNTATITRKYKAAEFTNAFTLTAENADKLDKWLNSRDAIGTGSGFNDSPVARQRFIKFLEVMAEPAVQGSGTATVIRVAGYGYDQGLPLNVAQAIMWEHYNPRCVPPWGQNEQSHFDEVVERAYHYARNEPGCKTAVASFANLPPVPAPLPPQSTEEVIRTGDRLDKKDAAAMRPMMNAKSPHYDLAKVFDGMAFDGSRLICCEKIFYVFNGKSWCLVSDSVLRAGVQRFYKAFKPADKLVSGIFACLRDLVNIKAIENGTWLHTGILAKDVVCFKNGLVDLSCTPPKIMPHTPDFFTFNELLYDYNLMAECPRWLAFLREIFSYDLRLVDQLQEFLGYCLVGDVSLQKFAVLVGKSRAGKGVIAAIIRHMVGEHNTSAPSLSNFVKDSVLHKLSSASVGLIPDAHSVSSSTRDAVLANFKAIVGGDPMDYHVMYKGVQTTVFKVKLILSTNGMPEFNDPSGALVNRMLVFPFYKSVAGREDAGLTDRLLQEIPGIAQWALIGLNRLRVNGRFTEADTGRQEKECIAEDMNPMSRFIHDVCSLDANAFTSNDDLYRTYQLWAKQHEVTHTYSQGKVVREINSSPMGITQERARVGGKQVRGFKGLQLVKFAPIV